MFRNGYMTVALIVLGCLFISMLTIVVPLWNECRAFGHSALYCLRVALR